MDWYLPAFSPDRRQIAFAATAEGSSAQDIYVMNVDGTNSRRLTTHPDSDTTPTWSPSGTQIAFTSDRTGKPQIYIMNIDGSGLRRLPIPDGEADRATWAPAPFNEIAYTARNGPGYDIKVHELVLARRARSPSAKAAMRAPPIRRADGTSHFNRRARVRFRSSRLAATAMACGRLRARATTRHLTGRTEIPLEIRCVTH